MVKLPLFSTKQAEAELLLCCARTAPTSAHTARLRTLLQQPLDWKYVIRVAERNRVQVLLYKNLNALCQDIIPAEVLTKLRHVHRSIGARNLFLTKELAAILQLLAAQNISAIAYKGAILAHSLYGNLALREFGDLDIVVREQDVSAARALLLGQEFVQVWPESALSPADEKTHLKQKYNYTLMRPHDRLIVELHWGITPRYLQIPPCHAYLWQRLEFVPLAGQQIMGFPPEELLLILCTHGANHCWIQLNWICDIAELLRVYPDIDWDYLLELAGDWRAERILLTGLYLAQSLLDASLPPGIQQRIAADATAVALAEQSYKWLFSEQWLHFTPFEEPLYHLRTRERWSDRINYCLNIMQPSAKDSQSFPLPYTLSYLQYLLRPIRLGVEHGLKRSRLWSQ